MPSSSPTRKRVRPMLGTFVEIELHGASSSDRLDELMTAGFETIEQIDRLMSYHRRDSDLTRLNAAPAGVWVRLDPDTIQVLRAANELYRRSKGAFDIRCGRALVQAGILPATACRPAGRLVKARRENPVDLRGTQARKTGPWTFDLGGIAKGYAVDCAVTRIQVLSRGLRLSGVVNAGGDLRAWGDQAFPSAVRIDSTSASWWRKIPVRQTAVAGSSIRSSSVEVVRFSPSAQVRMPAGVIVREKKTALVFAGKCLWADALTKVVLLGPPESAADMLSCYGARALIFRTDGHVEQSIN